MTNTQKKEILTAVRTALELAPEKVICLLADYNACDSGYEWFLTQPSMRAAYESCERGDWLLWFLLIPLSLGEEYTEGVELLIEAGIVSATDTFIRAACFGPEIDQLLLMLACDGNPTFARELADKIRAFIASLGEV